MTNKFNTLLKIFMMAFLGITIIGATAMLIYTIFATSTNNWVNSVIINLTALLVAFSAFFAVRKALHHNVNQWVIIISIVIFSTIIKAIWIISTNTSPISDFKVILDSGRAFLNGDYSSSHGHGYIARFPHLAYTTLFFALVEMLFTNPLKALKTLNIALSAVDIVLVYLIVSEIKSKTQGIYTALLMALFMPFTAYTSVACSENLAIPFFLLGIFLLIKAVKNNTLWLFALSGVALSLGNLLRMVGIVFLTACVIYLIFNVNLNKIKATLLVICSFLAIYFLADAILINSGVMEYHLWHGNEPAITSVLKGTNTESGGAWNYEDTNLHEKNGFDYDKTANEAKKVIIQRLTNPNILQTLGHYSYKLLSQWSMGDFMGIFWAENAKLFNGKMSPLLIFSQLFYLPLLVNAFIKIKKNRENCQFMPLFWIILLCFVLLYLAIETQPRYGYIVAWLFLIIAV